MRNFFRRLQQEQNPLDITSPINYPLEYPKLQKHYVHFCQNRFFGKDNPDELFADLEGIIRMPEITHLAFRENNQGLDMLVGTKHVYLKDPTTGRVHDIGEFLMIINKKNKLLRFENISGPITQLMDGKIYAVYHHPHINHEGTMCIASGKTELFEYISEGRMFSALRMIVAALWTSDQFPYPGARLDCWPLKQ